MLRKTFCLLLLASTLGHAEERTREEWVKELTATYVKLDGFMATYRSQGEGKSLEVVLGRHEGSRRAVLHMKATKGGQTMDLKQWNTDSDEQFTDTGGRRMVITGIDTEITSLNELLRLWGVEEKAEAIPVAQYIPSFVMTADSLVPSFNFATRDEPSWKNLVEGATVKEIDEKKVSFETKEHGLLDISRETGLLVRQVVAGVDGESRVLELSSVRSNPSKGEVTEVSADWKGDGAQVVARAAMLAPIRMKVFQTLIQGVEEGQIDLKKLDARLEEQRDILRRLAGGWTSEVGGALAGDDFWKKALDRYRNTAEETYREEHGGTDEEVGKFVDKLLADGLNRGLIRDKMAIELVDVEPMRELFLFELSGKNREVKLLAAKTKAGDAAKKSMETALFRAYCEAVLESKMTNYWGERQGLD